MAEVYLPSPTGSALFALLFWAWAAFEGWVNLKEWQSGSTNRDRFSRYAIVAGMLVAFALALAATSLHRFDIRGFRATVFYAGLALMAVGLAFRWLAIRQLGRFFIPEVAIQPGHRVVDTGLYRHIRHPSYTGTFVTIIGYGLALTNWLSLAAMLLVSAPLYAFRIRIEEAALLDALGDDYRAYQRRTRRLIPFLF